MKYLLTGASGFLGNYFVNNIDKSKNQITKLGRSLSNDIICDLSNEIPRFKKSTFDVIIHAAGKAHSFSDDKSDFDKFDLVNVNGTKNLLNSMQNQLQKISQFVLISSVSVYGLDTGIMIDENHPLKGNSAYALSKIKAENLVQKWGEKHNIPVLILRLPLLIGSNPKGNLKRMINAIRKKRYFSINGGIAKKSMVLASDVADFTYLNHKSSGVYNLTDGISHSVRDLENKIGKHFNVKIYNLPISIAKGLTFLNKIFRKFPLNNKTLAKIISDLTFSDSRAKNKLKWYPKNSIKHFKIDE